MGEAGSGGRERQRRRTRRAIVAAAVELLRRGDDPSVAEIAAAADVSRRTVYLYFPTLEQLLADAALEGARATVEPSFELRGDAGERIEGLVRSVQQGFAETEALGRTIIRLTVGAGRAPPAVAHAVATGVWSGSSGPSSRCARRFRTDRFERLVSGLTLLIGWEAMIVLQDTRALTVAEAEEVCVWAARALLAAATAPGGS